MCLKEKLPVLQWGGTGNDGEIPHQLKCLWKGSGPLALIRPILPWNVPGSTSLRPGPLWQCFFFFFFTFIFSKTPPFLYFLLLYFSLSPTLLVALYVFLSPAADCCSSNLCTRLGMFFMLFASLPVSAPPVSPLVHNLPPFI